MKLRPTLLHLASAIVIGLGLIACDDAESNLSRLDPSFPDNNSTNENKNDATGDEMIAQLQFPKVSGGSSEVIHHSTSALGLNYSIEWDHALRAQRWTCYTFNASNSVQKWSRNSWYSTSWGGDPFQFDPVVPTNEQPPVKGEFSGSYYPGTNRYYDRGHICASQDRVCSQDANEQTFYMTNMMPQVNSFNAGIWAQMEIAVRDRWNKSNFRDVLYVVKGGTIDRASQILARTKSGFIVPRYFFMALLCKNGSQYKAMAFWVEHLNEDHSMDNLADYVINVDRLEQLTGIDFFCNLPDDVENEVEGTARSQILRDWNL
ncbi:MAG: DNA/RNA non-specific endonuclease [Prevotella sp.]|nr:DNA/RNA non-specific endonuclease [Prevotella sp.]